MSEPNKTRTIPLHIADQAVAACEAEIQKLKEENARLKDKSACQTECLDAFEKKLREAEAEVERLNTGIQPEGSNDAVGRAVNVLLEKENEIARLKAEVERLRNAGDDLVLHVEWRNVVFTSSHAFTFREVIPDCRCSLHNFDKVIEAWNAAKEGKQS